MPRFSARFLALNLADGAVVQACGPSVQTIYEGNVRFEHCYRLDLDVNKAPTHRHACWKEWLAAYTYAQPRDRIEYARRRVHSIETGDVDRPTLKLSSEHDPNERHYYLSGPVPVPADPHSPPPALAQAWDAGAKAAPAPASGADADAGAPVPEAACTAACRKDWQSCLDRCNGPSNGWRPSVCDHCEPDYLNCMRRCFQ
jgi:hypothetical protein